MEVMSLRGLDGTADDSGQLRATKPHRLGKYRFIAGIGRGGMADVYLAVMEGPSGFSKLIAVKVLRQQFAEQMEGREMFLNEARLASRLSHPNVVSVLEVGEEDGSLFIAMEYLRGHPLSRLMAKIRAANTEIVPQAVLLRILSETLAGLHHAHESTEFDGTPLMLVHRDVTPHNIFVTYDGSVKVLDFGIAKAVSNSNETREGILKGKVAFMAPEQLMADAVIDRRVDIYSVGCCLWEVVAKRRPFKGMSDVALLTRVATKGAPPIREAVPDIPDELERICNKAVAFHASDRYQDAAEFQSDLDAYIASVGVPSGRKEIGKYLGDIFAEERDQTKHMIEVNLSKAALSTSEVLAAQSLVATGSNSASWSSSGPGSGSNSGLHMSGGTDQSAAISVAEGRAQPGRGAKLVVAAAVGLLVIGSAVFVLRPKADPNAGAPVPSAVPDTTIKVRLSAMPPSARMFLDGASVSTNPAELEVKRDGAQHSVRAEAPGHVARTEQIIFDADKNISLMLEVAPAEPAPDAEAAKPAPVRVVGGGPGPRVAPPPTTAAPPPTTAAPPPTTAPVTTTPAPDKAKQKRQLDDSNPFDKK